MADANSTSEEAWIHAIKEINYLDFEEDWIFAPQLTSPLREPNDIRNACKLALEGSYDSILSVVSFDDFFLWRKIIQKLNP